MDFPVLPNYHTAAVIALIVVALYLFTRDQIALETSSLAVLAVLALGFEVFPYSNNGKTLHAIDFFKGFGHEALVAVCALMIAGKGLVRTGSLEPVGRGLARLWKTSPTLSLLLTLVVAGVFSAFVNNVPIVVLLLPILVSVSIQNNKPASAILMPMGFATLVGGMSTTIGTSTNLLVVSVAADLGMRRLGMFDFFLPAIIAGGVAIIYLWLIAPRILPKRDSLMQDVSPRIFSAQLHVDEGCFADGKTLKEVMEKSGDRLKVLEIRRQSGTVIIPLPDAIIKAGDEISVRDTPENLKNLEELLGTKLYKGDTMVDEEHPLKEEDQQLAEIVVTQGSSLDNSTLAKNRFADIYQLVILALHLPSVTHRKQHTNVSNTPLSVGDVLLVQGSREQIAAVKRSGDLMVLDATSDLPHTKKAPIALLIMALVILVAALGIAPIAISAVCGVLIMIATRCISWEDASQALSTQVVMIVVASLALGTALISTGGADYLAQVFLYVSSGASPVVVLSGLMLLMAILTNIVSNNAAAVIGTPIAIGIAKQLNLPVEPFVLAVLFGANMSYATPMAYKTNLLVFNAGGYKFSDFLRAGIPLTLIVWLTLSFLLPVLYKLN